MPGWQGPLFTEVLDRVPVLGLPCLVSARHRALSTCRVPSRRCILISCRALSSRVLELMDGGLARVCGHRIPQGVVLAVSSRNPGALFLCEPRRGPAAPGPDLCTTRFVPVVPGQGAGGGFPRHQPHRGLLRVAQAHLGVRPDRPGPAPAAEVLGGGVQGKGHDLCCARSSCGRSSRTPTPARSRSRPSSWGTSP